MVGVDIGCGMKPSGSHNGRSILKAGCADPQRDPLRTGSAQASPRILLVHRLERASLRAYVNLGGRKKHRHAGRRQPFYRGGSFRYGRYLYRRSFRQPPSGR